MQSKQKRNPAAFLRNTYNILMVAMASTQKGQLEAVIGWTPDGSAFEIRNLSRFEGEVLPLFFKHKKFSSFVRQLNMYGFHKLRYSEHENTFQHDKFRKGADLLSEIKRKPEKKKKVRTTSGSEQLVKQDTLPEESRTSQQHSASIDSMSEASIEQKELEQAAPALQFTAQDQCCVRLCQLLMAQNRILSRNHMQLRRKVLEYKRYDIEFQSTSIRNIERVLYQPEDFSQNPQMAQQPTRYLLSNLGKLDERQREQTVYLKQLTSELTMATRQLINTNYSMFSTTSIEAGYSTARIQEARGL